MRVSSNPKPVLVIAAVLAVGLAVPAGRAQKAGWKAKILTENGVRVVVNPAEPLYPEIKIALEEELRIGKEGDERTQFYRVRDIHADLQGNIYVDDMSNGRVQVFGPQGAFLRTIGRRGQGPGEFENPTLIRFGGREGRLHVMDRYQRINLFDGQGLYIRSLVPERGFIDYFPDAADGFAAVMHTGSDEDLTSGHALCRLDANGRTRAVLAEFPSNAYMARVEGGTFMATTGYEMTLYAAPLPGQGLVYGHSKEYELVVLGPEDTKALLIRKDEPRPEFTSEEKRGFGKIPVPGLKPYFYGILTDPQGRIYVQRNMNTSVKRGFGPVAAEDKQFDVFSREGTFLFRASLPPNTRLIRDGLVYSYSVDEDRGLEFAQRFRIKNYADLPVK
jgi:6-bladed beta-propeller